MLFPNYLMHTAYPFNVDAERRSFSFNVKVSIQEIVLLDQFGSVSINS